MDPRELYYNRIQKTASFIKTHLTRDIPDTAIMMGTGLSGIVDHLSDTASLDYEEIPNFPAATVQSHRGKLIVGKLNGQRVVVLAGRWHYYEGYSTKQLTFPIRVLSALGVNRILFTNVSGGVNEAYNTGDIVLIRDHINLIPDHPLRGPNDDRLGLRFPDMLKVYNADWRDKIHERASALGIDLKSGVYLALSGPSLETPAEYQFVHRVGGDMVGMSTVPEVIVAHHEGMEVAALSIISNVCYPPERIQQTTVEDVIAVAEESGGRLITLIKEVV